MCAEDFQIQLNLYKIYRVSDFNKLFANIQKYDRKSHTSDELVLAAILRFTLVEHRRISSYREVPTAFSDRRGGWLRRNSCIARCVIN